jgi:hypothetical protein
LLFKKKGLESPEIDISEKAYLHTPFLSPIWKIFRNDRSFCFEGFPNNVSGNNSALVGGTFADPPPSGVRSGVA